MWDGYRDPLDLFPGGHTYAGGATRLHLLRNVIGEEAFRLGLRRYVAENAGSSVTTADLRESMELASGRDLELFFDQWLFAPGFPEFATQWRWDEKRKRLLLTVHQTQGVEDGTPQAFVVPVDVEVRTPAGRWIERIELGKRRELIPLDCAERPTWVRFDKYGAIPKIHRAEKGLDEWERIAREDDDVGGRRDAVFALAQLAASETVQDTAARCASVIGWLLQEDESRFVRREAARALGRLRRPPGLQLGPAAIEALKQAASWDADPAVRVAAFEALAGWGRNADLESFGKSEFERAPTWATMAAAAGLVCAADPWGAQDWLVARLDRPSPPRHPRESHGRPPRAPEVPGRGRRAPAARARLRGPRSEPSRRRSRPWAVSRSVATRPCARWWSSSIRPRRACAGRPSRPSANSNDPAR